MEMSTLKELFQRQGFQIVEELELTVIKEENPEWRSRKDMAGIIAKKLEWATDSPLLAGNMRLKLD